MWKFCRSVLVRRFSSGCSPQQNREAVWLVGGEWQRYALPLGYGVGAAFHVGANSCTLRES